MRPTALITGSSRGLGAAIARELAPTHDLLLGARSAQALEPICAELPGSTPLPLDLTDYDAVAAAASSITTLDVLVHNAGVADIGTIEESSVDQWRRTLEQTSSPSRTHAGSPARASCGWRSRRADQFGCRTARNAGWGSYAASKFALRAFGDALRLEEPALRVTSIHPGRIDTDMQRDIVAGEGDEYDPERFLKASTVARAVLTAVETPSDAHPTEIVLRPTGR